MTHVKLIRIRLSTLVITVFAGAASAQPAAAPQWFKGNTHTHTWWSDGDSPPETVVRWYKEHGYNFLVLSDHNILSEGEKWIRAEKARAEAAKIYESEFSDDWIEKRERGGKTEYRLKTLTEFRPLFEDAGRFLLIQGEEITDSFEKYPVHINGINLRNLIPPQKGRSALETMQNNINAVVEQERITGQTMFAHLNHPNFVGECPFEDVARLENEQFFEVFNGHPHVRNYGEGKIPSMDRVWDFVLTERLARLKLPVMYGLAVDDAHHYMQNDITKASPGKGWVMVRSKFLTPTHIVDAMKRGDFYATTGVVLDKVEYTDGRLEIQIQPRAGITYKTQFIGTLAEEAQAASQAAEASTQPVDLSARPELGRILSEQTGENAKYEMTGRELYVRAKIISTAKHPNPFAEGDVEVAWVQPVQPTR